MPRRSDASCRATSRLCPRRSRGTAERSRSTPATPSWPPSASRSRTRTTRSAPRVPRSTCAQGSPRSTSASPRASASALEVRIGLEAGEVVATPTDARQRLVTGEAVGIAAKLEQAAADGEIVVGEVAGRLIDHAARLEPLGPLEIKGKREPVQRVPARRAHAGRRRPSSAGWTPRSSAASASSPRCAGRSSARSTAARPARSVVVGPPGVGKSRLAAELTRRAKGVTTLWGRCLSYGEGITYWPLREVLAGAPESAERDAVLAALEAETPPPAPEIAWLFRQFCEAIAREQPLVLVFDDVHWAEPTFLELVEHLVGQGRGGRSSSSASRARSCSRSGRSSSKGVRTRTGSCSTRSRRGDGRASRGPGRRRCSSPTSAPASSRPPRATRSSSSSSSRSRSRAASPSARCRRRSRRCSRRASTGSARASGRCSSAGRSSGRSSRPTTSSRCSSPTPRRPRTRTCRTLAGARLRAARERRRLRLPPRPRAGGRLPRRPEAAPRGAARAYADRLDTRRRTSPTLDEFAGYHLEQAYRLRTELGESDRARSGSPRTAGAARRGWRSGAQARRHAGRDRICFGARPRSCRRTHRSRSELLCELGIACAQRESRRCPSTSCRRADRAARSQQAIRRIELRARIELEYVRLLRELCGRPRDELLDSHG